jgi:hypothetical protein
MAHHSSSTIPLDQASPRPEQHEAEGAALGCPASLRPGDICVSARLPTVHAQRTWCHRRHVWSFRHHSA